MTLSKGLKMSWGLVIIRDTCGLKYITYICANEITNTGPKTKLHNNAKKEWENE